jgi:hypothetical protein
MNPEHPVAVLAMTLAMVLMVAFALMFAGPALPTPVQRAIASVPAQPAVVATSPIKRKECT